MSLDDLYRDVILDHYRSPRHRGSLTDPDAHAEGFNPLCGDQVAIDIQFDGDTVSDVAITGQGCSISQSSASMMSEAILGKSREEIRVLVARFKGMMSVEDGIDPELDPDRPGAVLGDLESLQGVKQFPVRIKCANLAWTTLEEALRSPSSGALR